MSFLLSWIGVGIALLIIEILTASFYGLSLALAAFSVAGYVAIKNETFFSITQGVIFVVVTLVFLFILPKFFNKNVEDSPQGLDVYLGQKAHVHLTGEDAKVFLDGVPYKVIAQEGELHNGDFVRLISRQGSVFQVEKV